MNKDQRLPFLNLAKEINWGLCGFCNFASYSGVPCTDSSGMDCMHPLTEIISPLGIIGEPGVDCWGFRPSMKMSKVQEIVRTIIERNIDPEQAYYTYDFNEQLELEINVYGQVMTPIPAVFKI